MRTFFHGWRRKTGVVTLVVSCALMGLWMRSQLVGDTWCWSVGHETEVVISEDGMLSWWRLATQRPVARFWNPGFVSQSPDGTRYATIGDWGVELGLSDSLTVPYWPFVIPLTLLSGYLMLWKPRKGDPGPTPQ
ncbi:MAG: hypothetical protein JWP89_3637 [Schlesneria sp.]|nr:hypothetical protein [Schlesneria sp.]